MPRTANLSDLSHGDLLYAVHDLIARKRITSAEVRQTAGRAGRIAELERQLVALKGNGVSRAPSQPAKKGAPKKRKFTMTPKARAARKLQGQYIGALRALTADQKHDVKIVAKKEGVAEALKLAKKYKAESREA